MRLAGRSLTLRPGAPGLLRDLPDLGLDDFRETVISEVEAGGRLLVLLGRPLPGGGGRLVAVLREREEGAVAALSTVVPGTYPSLTPDCPQAHLFEREIFETLSIEPAGHPWLKPVRRPAAETKFFRVEGAEIHEVAVGPVHAGVIEPGHFRFQCHGERVLHLEIALGYQHRGIERAMISGPEKRRLPYVETAAGDTTIGHATAYAGIVETLAGTEVPARAQAIRGAALELERLANHCGDLGALAGDVGFLPTASFCGRIRGDFLNATAEICGSRFGRGLVRPGGTGFDMEPERIAGLRARIGKAAADAAQAADLLWNSPSVMARFEGTGRIDRATAEALGLVGVAARACGIERDVRYEAPSGIFRFSQIPVTTWHTGDVFGRASVRAAEIRRSAVFLDDLLRALPEGPVRAPAGALAAGSLAVSFVEGWRGEIAHVAATDDEGRLDLYKIVDPSFHNWMGLAMAMRGEPISDFPLCNKSFNLSYCGHDL